MAAPMMLAGSRFKQMNVIFLVKIHIFKEKLHIFSENIHVFSENVSVLR